MLVVVLVLGKLSYQALPIQSLGDGHNRESDSNSQHEETSGERRDVARSASPQDRPPTKQAERSAHTNPVQLMPPRFEHEYPGKAGLFWLRHEHIGGRVLSRLPAPGAKALAISPKTETD